VRLSFVSDFRGFVDKFIEELYWMCWRSEFPQRQAAWVWPLGNGLHVRLELASEIDSKVIFMGHEIVKLL
jgi:hypothetical protein